MNEEFFIEKFINTLEKIFKKYQKKLKEKKLAVFVSGGIDSSIIAYFTSKFFKKITLITLTSTKADDLKYVKILNQKLKQNLIIVDFNSFEIKKIKPKIALILEKSGIPINPTHISLACGFYLLSQKAKEEKVEIAFTGQGPDILLAGYHRYQTLPLTKLNEKIKNDLHLLIIDKKRDQGIGKYFNLKLVNPYLEKEFINFSLTIPPELKIGKIKNEVYEKYLSRKVGEKLNLPEEIILRHKKALQYSTKIRKYV